MKANIVPRFLRFRVPNNGCFDDREVHEFQLRLLRKELYKAGNERKAATVKLSEVRNELKQKLPVKCIPSIILHSLYDLRILRQKQIKKLNDKLYRLSEEQERTLFNVQNTVICYNIDRIPPKFVMDTLSLGPKNAILEKFNQNDVLSELD